MQAEDGATHGRDEAQKFCTFSLGGIVVGIDVQDAQEVLRHDRLTPVPLAPRELVGLINLRGEIVPALDLRRQLGLPVQNQLGAAVVVRAGNETVALLVEEIGDVVEPSFSDYEPVPASVPSQVREVLRGTYKLEGALLLVLELERLAARFDQGAHEARRALQAQG